MQTNEVMNIGGSECLVIDQHKLWMRSFGEVFPLPLNFMTLFFADASEVVFPSGGQGDHGTHGLLDFRRQPASTLCRCQKCLTSCRAGGNAQQRETRKLRHQWQKRSIHNIFL